MKENGFIHILIIAGIVLLLVGYLVYQKQPNLMPFFQKNGSGTVIITGPSPDPTSTTAVKKSTLDVVSDEWKGYVISDILPQYPNLQKEINSKEINRVFPLAYIDDHRPVPTYKSWLIEIKTSTDANYSNHTNYYLATPEVQKQLVDAVSTIWPFISERECSIENFYTPGNEAIDRKSKSKELADKKGYIVLSGNCSGVGSNSFTSVYKLSNGEKVRLQESDGISDKKGNANGKIRGIYGLYSPAIVVEYGQLYEENGLEAVSATAYFDLQSGQLKQVIKFN